MAILIALLFAVPGEIHVRVEGDAEHVYAWHDGMAVAVAKVEGGRAVLTGLDAHAEYAVEALGKAHGSLPVHGVRAVAGGSGFDVTLRVVPTHAVNIETEDDAMVHWLGTSRASNMLRLPGGLHRIVVEHFTRVSSAERIVRVDGPVSVAVPLDAGLRIRGRVVDANGAAVHKAHVEAFADGYATRRFAYTDEEGGFALSGIRGRVVSIQVEASGHARALRRVVFYPGEERARVEVALKRGTTKGVRVNVEAEGVLLPAWYEDVLEEPRLRANHSPVRTRGRFLRFSHLTPGREYRVIVKAPGYLPVSTKLESEVRLVRGATIEGTAGGPGLRVRCGDKTYRTDRAGRFVFEGLDAGEYILSIRGVDERGVKVSVAAGERKRIKLVPGGERPSIKGLVFDADGQPLPGVVVEAGVSRAVTDETGAFELTGLAAGRPRHILTFQPGTGCRALVSDPHLPYVERKVAAGADVRVRLQRAGSLWVRLDPGDRTLARARLHISGVSGVNLVRQIPRKTREVRVDDVPVGRYVVEVSAPGVLGTGDAVVEVGPGPKKPVEVTVIPGRAARGTVVLRRHVTVRGGAPIKQETPVERGWVVLLDGNPLRGLATVPIDADGSFVLEGLPPTTVYLCAGVPGLPPVAVRVDLTSKDAKDVVLPVQAGVEAAIKVLGDQDKALVGARVRFLTDYGVDVRDLASLVRFRRIVADEEDLGSLRSLFQLERGPASRVAAPFLTPGSYRVIVSVDGYKAVRVGVRARNAVAVAELRAGFLKAGAPLPDDLASPVRLEHAPDPAKED